MAENNQEKIEDLQGQVALPVDEHDAPNPPSTPNDSSVPSSTETTGPSVHETAPATHTENLCAPTTATSETPLELVRATPPAPVPENSTDTAVAPEQMSAVPTGTFGTSTSSPEITAASPASTSKEYSPEDYYTGPGEDYTPEVFDGVRSVRIPELIREV